MLKKNFSFFITFISLFLLIYIFYRSEIYWDGDKREYYFVYYIASLVLILFSILTFFINQKIKEYLFILIISLVGSFYLFEFYLTFPSKFYLYEKQNGKKWDKRTKLEVYKDLYKENKDIVLKLPPSIYLLNKKPIFSLSGISNSETINCNENGYYMIYQSDRYGFNNPDEEWDKKKIEYLLVGDSFIHGECVNRPNDIASTLRALSNKSVLNLGYGGTGPLIQYAILREYINSNVKKVFWFYYEGNDLLELKEEKNNKILISYFNDLNFSQDLKLKQNEIDSLARKYLEVEINKRNIEEKNFKKESESFNFKFKLIKFLKIYNTRKLIFPGKSSVPILSSSTELTELTELKEILKLTKDLTNKNNSELYFFYLPEYSRYKKKYDNTNYNLVKNTVNQLKIPFIDIHLEVFEKQPNPLELWPYELFGHYNVKGYKKISEKIYELTKN